MSTGRGTMMLTKTRHKAPHKPKTYVEQLQELNAPFKHTGGEAARTIVIYLSQLIYGI